ncbi:hypothetical protein EVAR_76917_1 [Eumeta japonica]|uniref:Uncharacterized protein n=1 Tax=Eumeta variegata TaxID=151549 RepID=A0A4C1SER5_EUMVA|nr:hypothetical protein EVAR_76917_1 [Eumeta japonica]
MLACMYGPAGLRPRLECEVVRTTLHHKGSEKIHSEIWVKYSAVDVGDGRLPSILALADDKRLKRNTLKHSKDSSWNTA